MPCYRLPQGFICFSKSDAPHCAEGDGYMGDYLCDYPVGDGKTCDRPICETHAHEVAPEIHYCPSHHSEWLVFKESGGVKRELENVVPFKKQ